jgi:hypothetical protein
MTFKHSDISLNIKLRAWRSRNTPFSANFIPHTAAHGLGTDSATIDAVLKGELGDRSTTFLENLMHNLDVEIYGGPWTAKFSPDMSGRLPQDGTIR